MKSSLSVRRVVGVMLLVAAVGACASAATTVRRQQPGRHAVGSRDAAAGADRADDPGGDVGRRGQRLRRQRGRRRHGDRRRARRGLRGYIECLAAGGAAGRYAYDIELRTGLVVDWSLESTRRRSQRAQRRLLAPLPRRPDEPVRSGQPAGRRPRRTPRDSIAACVDPISPEAAANLPAAITVGTTGETTSVGELQLDPAALDPESLGSSPADTTRSARASPRWAPNGGRSVDPFTLSQRARSVGAIVV